MKLLPYQDLNDFVQLCIKVEQQLLRKGFKTINSNSSTKKDCKREGEQLVEEEPSSRGKEKREEKEKERLREGTSSHTHISDIKCFKCLGRGHISS